MILELGSVAVPPGAGVSRWDKWSAVEVGRGEKWDEGVNWPLGCAVIDWPDRGSGKDGRDRTARHGGCA